MTDVRERIDPEVRARLDQYVELVGPAGLSGIADIAERRRRQADLTALVRRESAPGSDTGAVERSDHVARAGVPVRLYRPRGAASPAPCVLYLHGGGLVAGSVAGDDGKAAALAEATGLVVASVDYRLAPEHRYPAAFDDCRAALGLLADRHAALGIDPDRIAVYGTSAGGGLAVAVALHARDHAGPRIAQLVLVSPMLDDRDTTPSGRTNTGFGAWSREANVQSWQAYLGPAPAEVSPYAAPARADDLSGLPPVFVDTGDLDLFRDECLDLAQRLMWAGVPVELHVHPGAIHGGESLAPAADLTRRTHALRIAALQRALAHSQA